MIARVMYGKLRADCRPEEWSVASEQAVKAHAGLKGLKAVHLLQPVVGQEAALLVSFWETKDDSATALSGRQLIPGLARVSSLLDEPCRVRYQLVEAPLLV